MAQTRSPSLPARALRPFGIPNPGVGENWWVAYAFSPIVLVELVVVLRGSSSPEVTWDLVYAPLRNESSPTSIFAAPQQTSNVSAGDIISSFQNDVVPAGNHLWLEVSGVSGLVDEFSFGGLVRGFLL